jgi:lycopene cyclase CruA
MSLCAIPKAQSIPDINIFSEYESSHPLTVKHFKQMQDGTYWFQRLLTIESSFMRNVKDIPKQVISHAKNLKGEKDFDIVYGGGGLAIIHAALMSKVYGYSVCLFDKYGVGLTHRDWNISYQELLVLRDCGLFTEEQLQSFITCTYRSGFVKFHDANSAIKTPHLWMDHVLDNALDANALLSAAREMVISNGGVILDNAEFTSIEVDGTMAHVKIKEQGIERTLITPLFIDGMGAFSPIAKALNPEAPFTHCCPTVGSISSGFKTGTGEREVDFSVGEILVTNEDMLPDGRQLIWEGFPSSNDRLVTYLFFYDAIDSPSDKSLLNLYELFFEKLSTYKEPGEHFDIGRPLFGITPSYSHKALGNARISADDNILCIGDAAALSSPLSYCGFGSFVRNLPRMTKALHQAIQSKQLTKNSLKSINAFESRVAIMSNFAAFLQGKKGQPANTVNETMNLFMDVLAHLPNHIAQEVFRDTMKWESYNIMMSTVPKRHPMSYKILIRTHGFWGLLRWALNFIGFTLSEKRKKS